MRSRHNSIFQNIYIHVTFRNNNSSIYIILTMYTLLLSLVARLHRSFTYSDPPPSLEFTQHRNCSSVVRALLIASGLAGELQFARIRYGQADL